jgi:hypothetical protein
MSVFLTGGQANVFLQSANRQSANSWAYSAFEKPEIFKVVPVGSSQIGNFSQIIRKSQIS